MDWLHQLWQSLYEGSSAIGGYAWFIGITLALVVIFLVSIAGCLLPVVPGPALAFCGVVLWKFTIGANVISWWSVVICLFLTLLAQLVDYILPMKYAPTKSGTWGALVGVLAGLVLAVLFPPFALFAIFLSPLVFAFGFEYASNKDIQKAWKTGKGAFLGTILTVVAKAFIIFIMIAVVLTDIGLHLVLN